MVHFVILDIIRVFEEIPSSLSTSSSGSEIARRRTGLSGTVAGRPGWVVAEEQDELSSPSLSLRA